MQVTESFLSSILTYFVNGVYALILFQSFIPLYLIYARLQCFNEFLNLLAFDKISKQEFRNFHALIFKIFDVIDVVNQTFGFQLLIITLEMLTSGSFTNFAIFEAVIFEDQQYANFAAYMIFDNSLDYFGFTFIFIIASLITNEVRSVSRFYFGDCEDY